MATTVRYPIIYGYEGWRLGQFLVARASTSGRKHKLNRFKQARFRLR